MKKLFYTLGASMAIVAALSLSSCNKGDKGTSGGGDTIRIEAPSKVVNINSDEFCKSVATADAPFKYLGKEPAIIDFWATWCGPCRTLAPLLEQLSAETGVTVYKVDIDQNGDLANVYHIKYVPQLYYCSNDTIVPIENEGSNYSLNSLKALVRK